ncbi:MAG: CPBP family intramembrane metalloprotease [Clostridia bacterium]|nr:CPBP family intramembrane metalloprotease [Clostridia bacterium]
MKKNEQKQEKTIRTRGVLFGLLGEPTPAKRSGGVYTASLLFMEIISLIFSVIVLSQKNFTAAEMKKDWYLYLSFLLPQVAFLLAILEYRWQKKERIQPLIRAQKCHWKYFVIAVVLQIGLLSLSQVNTWFLQLLQRLGYKIQAVSIPSTDGIKIVGVLLVVALLPAVLEETVFRGLLLKGMRCFGTTGAILLSGALFALYHRSPEQTVYQFCCGAAFALMAIRSGSVLPTMVSHFINNAVIVIFEACGVAITGVATWIVFAISAVCLALALVYLIFFEKNTLAPMKEESERKAGRKNFFFAAAVGIILCVLTWCTNLISGF